MLFSNQTASVVVEILKCAELVRLTEGRMFHVVGVADLDWFILFAYKLFVDFLSFFFFFSVFCGNIVDVFVVCIIALVTLLMSAFR